MRSNIYSYWNIILIFLEIFIYVASLYSFYIIKLRKFPPVFNETEKKQGLPMRRYNNFLMKKT
jgi:hypothetical protein